ncbi:NADPH-dependent FMN reductase [Neisseria chenwenguii]|uniref:NAD(P)H-dependent oxidoreductase n=1 Tax=Neisseria chenwenguii TaxID=1853278 RepID=A0A220S2U7_9NEIS|nr:NADPH-dependent FMN reductase [Neisseria chenwenguii]ASK27800.1 NAD(P)H-dependent oxidoreductase [Neisseria chenwenguii]ROV56542.1 NAD(P)H-dependent oxidoreductase [Neisseria chenwenguii]
MSKKVSILVGSLRKGSFARKTAQNVIPMFPADYEAKIVEIGGLPLYSFDYDDPNETDCPVPESYTQFRETIKASAGVLFVTAENNRTVPACLKNAIDIGSKPNADVAWKNVPAGIISHSVGKMGGYSAHKNLRLALSYFDMPLTGQPEIFLGNSPTMFDEEGKLVESARKFVQSYIEQLVALIEKNPK